MKEKNVAGILALFMGPLGIHRFYLGQPGLGIAYLIFFWNPVVWLIAFIDAIIFFTMDDEVFDVKYNRLYENQRRSQQRKRQEEREDRQDNRQQRQKRRETRRPQQRKQRNNPYRESGIQKYKDYDFKGAIEDFKKSLEINSNDKNVHFILSCSYSLMENTKASLFHLNKAVEQGFVDFKKIEDHDALAFLRTQPEYEGFVNKGFQTYNKIEAPEQEEERALDDLVLNKIQRLGELKEKGFITSEEFEIQKKKLLG